jgi:hypothetical protein
MKIELPRTAEVDLVQDTIEHNVSRLRNIWLHILTPTRIKEKQKILSKCILPMV